MRRQHRGIEVGAAWISLMEPAAGFDLAFNRWYSDDHYYAGGMNLPGIFAGRRWVCTRELQQLRHVDGGSIFNNRADGKFLNTNLFARGQSLSVAKALGEVIADLFSQGRMHPEEIPRRHVYSRIQPRVATLYRDSEPDKPLDLHSLDYPYEGIVLEVVEARKDRSQVVEWLTQSFVPEQMDVCDADICMVFLDEDLPEILASKTKRIPSSYGEGPTQRISLLWFLQSAPEIGWDDRFARHPSILAHGGAASVLFLSPFLPLMMGSDHYMDSLR